VAVTPANVLASKGMKHVCPDDGGEGGVRTFAVALVNHLINK